MKPAKTEDIDQLDQDDLKAIRIECEKLLRDIRELKQTMVTKRDLQEFARDVTGILKTMIVEIEAALVALDEQKNEKAKEIEMVEELKYFCSKCGKQIEIGGHVIARSMSDIKCEACFSERDKAVNDSFIVVLNKDNHLRYRDTGYIIYWNKKE